MVWIPDADVSLSAGDDQPKVREFEEELVNCRFKGSLGGPGCVKVTPAIYILLLPTLSL